MSLAYSYFKYLAETHSGSKPKNLVGAVEDFEVCSSLLFFDVHSQLPTTPTKVPLAPFLDMKRTVESVRFKIRRMIIDRSCYLQFRV